MAKLMKYDSEEKEWKQMKLSEIHRFSNYKVFIDNKWIPIKELVVDDTDGN